MTVERQLLEAESGSDKCHFEPKADTMTEAAAGRR